MLGASVQKHSKCAPEYPAWHGAGRRISLAHSPSHFGVPCPSISPVGVFLSLPSFRSCLTLCRSAVLTNCAKSFSSSAKGASSQAPAGLQLCGPSHDGESHNSVHDTTIGATYLLSASASFFPYYSLLPREENAVCAPDPFTHCPNALKSPLIALGLPFATLKLLSGQNSNG